jgi:hypothetical protein
MMEIIALINSLKGGAGGAGGTLDRVTDQWSELLELHRRAEKDRYLIVQELKALRLHICDLQNTIENRR